MEIFDLKRQGADIILAWRGCVLMPEGRPGNSVSPLPGGGFLVSTFVEKGHTMAEMFDGVATGSVLEWRPKHNFREVPGTRGAGPNGLVVAQGGRDFFVAMTGLRQLLHIRRDGSVRQLPVNFAPDNLRWTPDGKILVAGRADEAACGGPMRAVNGKVDLQCPRAVVAIKLDPQSGEITTRVQRPSSPGFSGGSGAAQLGDEIWLAAVPSDRVAYQALNE